VIAATSVRHVSGAVIGVVLVGGASSRMGISKATVELGGVPLAMRALEPLRGAGLEVAVVAKEGDPLPPLDAPVWIEARPERHPLAGILEALERGGGSPVLACACDMPFVAAGLAAHLAGLPGTAVPEAGGRLHPLLARYDPRASGALEAALAARAPLHEAVRAAGAMIVPEAEIAAFGDPERLLFNVNTPADLARAAELL
jgi:molybdopterin-guanine dinucleotide biosynthesis protein A